MIITGKFKRAEQAIRHLSAENARLSALVEEAGEVMAPFSEQAIMYDGPCEEHGIDGCPDSAQSGEMLDLTVGQFRTAREMLAKIRSK